MRTLRDLIDPIFPRSFRGLVRAIPQRIRDQFDDNMISPSLVLPRLAEGSAMSLQIRVEQEIRETDYSENKRKNLAIAIRSLEGIIIRPGEVFSFWRFVPRPVSKNGYLEGRNLIGGKLVADIGGGLCQLSGLIYHGSLLAGLEIVERHPHSVDLYTDETRYTPLGTDATVSYGYKDLRIKNNLDVPIKFHFNLSKASIDFSIHASEPLSQSELQFEVRQLDGKTKVDVWRSWNNESVLISSASYFKNE